MIARLIAGATADRFQQALKLLQNAASSLSRSNAAAACGQVDAFINQVQAQVGKALTAEQAAQLLQRAADVQSALGCQ